ncbi:MAG TPA: hypothetical protein VK698_35195 [Kofleriaceae bacterium]|nr:hypothetical protein [Kofleriaceae bacterium]
MAEDPGFLLVQAGLVRDDQLLTAREARAQGGGTLGEHLVMAGSVDDDALTEFYASKLVIPRVAADELARIPPSVLKRIPADMAAEFRVVPISSDGELNLTLAMSDPADKHVVDEVAFFTGTYVVRAVATQLQIAWCLAHYYGVVTPLARARLVAPDDASRAYSDLEDDSDIEYGPTGREITPLIAPGTPWAVEEEEQTGPARLPFMQRRPSRRRTSELAPRSGTLDVSDAPPEPVRLPAVVVDDEELTGRRDFTGTDLPDPGDGEAGDEERTVERSTTIEPPILLDRPVLRGHASASRASAGSDAFLLLDQIKGQIKGRPSPQSPQTEPALGPLGSVDSPGRASHDTETSRGDPPAESAGENDTVKRQSKAERRGRRSRGQPTEPGARSDEATTDSTGRTGDAPAADAPATPAAAPQADSAQADAPPAQAALAVEPPARDDATMESERQMNGLSDGTTSGAPESAAAGATTGPNSGSNARSGAGNTSSVDDGWDVDDGWGPPGSTIPPDFRGPRPATDEDDEEGDVAAVAAGLDSAAAAATPGRGNSAAAVVPKPPPEPEPEPEIDPAVLAAEMERSSNRLLATLRALERAMGRDDVVELLLDHMGATLKRRAFFAVKSGTLVAFRQQGASIPGIGVAEMTLDEGSTFGQVAQSRLPYRGVLSSGTASEFVERALGGPGRGEVLVVPVAVRGRPVGLLYGDGPTARLVDEHQAVLGRAAGQALERILAARAARG